MVAIMIIFQIIIYFWKKKHYKSFFLLTLFCLWIFPFMVSIQYLYINMICIWIFYTLFILYIYKKSSKKPLDRKTPRLIYIFFYYLHKISNMNLVF